MAAASFNTIAHAAPFRGAKGDNERGLTLLELMFFLSIVAIGICSTTSLFINLNMSQHVAEERRIASLAAKQKLDEIRVFILRGHSLDDAFREYGPLPLPQGGAKATFEVPTLEPFVDIDPRDGSRPNRRSAGTVTIINDEQPHEDVFGFDYANACQSPPFGVDIDGNGSHLIETGFGPRGAAGYRDNSPAPFPLDLNGNGSDGSNAHPWDSNVMSGFVMLPVVVTIQWQGADGPRRFDLFAVLTADRITEMAK